MFSTFPYRRKETVGQNTFKKACVSAGLWSPQWLTGGSILLTSGQPLHHSLFLSLSSNTLLQRQCSNIACTSTSGSLHWFLLCHLNNFSFLFKIQLVLHSSGFNILNSTTSVREYMGSHTFFLSIMYSVLAVISDLWQSESVGGGVQVICAHSVWSLQRLMCSWSQSCCGC